MEQHPFKGPDGEACDQCGKPEGQHPVVDMSDPPPDPVTNLPPTGND